ncbi:MAG: hypothetical protein LC776_08805 [Acidobacteria bacterium]|nr:hypothetical protein [Acidobacteriota bacterium]
MSQADSALSWSSVPESVWQLVARKVDRYGERADPAYLQPKYNLNL